MAQSELPRIQVTIGNDGTANEMSFHWWDYKGDQLSASVFSLVRWIESNSRTRQLQNTAFSRFYANDEFMAINPMLQYGVAKANFRQPRYLTLNVIASCIDTVAAKTGKNRPRPQFMTEDGDYSLKRKANMLTQYLEGLFDIVDFYAKASKVYVDSCVWGTGCLKIFKDEANKQVCCERVLIDEIIVDDIEAAYGEPEQIHQKKFISRSKVIAMFPKHKKTIEACSQVKVSATMRSAADQILVIESWHLPSGPEAGDGKHTISCEKGVLHDEEWEKDHFPFVFMRWAEKQVGFWGRGLAEELRGIQIEINNVIRNISLYQRMVAVPRVFIERSAGVNVDHITDAPGGVVLYNGQPPAFQTAQAVSPEMYQYLEGLIDKAYKFTGISQQSAMSTKEPGISSGVAIREISDLGSERFMLAAERYERFCMDASKIMIEFSKELYGKQEGDGARGKEQPTKVMVKDKNFVRKIPWSDMDLRDDQYTMRVFSTGLLPSTPAGKFQAVQELYEAGFIDKDEAMSTLDIPDVKSVTSLKQAARDAVEKQLEQMVAHGKRQTPEPYMDLALSQRVVQAAYLKYMNEGVSEDRLQLMRDYVDECAAQLMSAQEASTPPAPPPQEAPPGA